MVGRVLRTRRKPKASDTPMTDAIAKQDPCMPVHMVPASFARDLERDRNHFKKAAIEWMRSWREIHDRVTQAEVAAEQARDLARNLYWAGWDLRRFARAYANDYDEADGKAGAIAADYAFHEASKNSAEILGEEAAK